MPKLTSPTATEVREFLETHQAKLTLAEWQRLYDLAMDIDNITPTRTQESKPMLELLDEGLKFYAEMKKRHPEKPLT